jgi:outer membrane lipoprotein-sorting protein
MKILRDVPEAMLFSTRWPGRFTAARVAIRVRLVLAAPVVGLALPLLFLTLAADDQKPLSVDEIIAKSIEARGGIDKIKGLESMRMSGTAVLNDQIQAAVRIVNKRPNLTRFEMDVNGATLVQAFDGKSSWSVNPFAKSSAPEAGPEARSRELREHTDMDGLLVDYKAKGRKVDLDGTEDVGGSPAWKLKVTEKDGGTDYIYIDTKTFLMVKSSSEHMGSNITFGDYRPVNGLMLPFRIEQNAAAGKIVMTLDKIETNVAVDEAQFHMPAAQGK